MDRPELSKLGKVGGVPGIALGAVVSVLGAVLGLTDQVPEAWRGPLFLVMTLGVVALAGLALAGWIRGGAQIAATEGDDSEARNEDYTNSGARQVATSRGKRAPAVNIKGDARQQATTRGKDAPAVNIRR
jgi:hypothetical protein